MISLKQLPGECFTRSLHGIHNNDEGLGVKFDTFVMQGIFLMKYKSIFYVLDRIWVTIIMPNGVKLLAKLSTCNFVNLERW